jgi:hypothetical protein
MKKTRGRKSRVRVPLKKMQNVRVSVYNLLFLCIYENDAFLNPGFVFSGFKVVPPKRYLQSKKLKNISQGNFLHY